MIVRLYFLGYLCVFIPELLAYGQMTNNFPFYFYLYFLNRNLGLLSHEDHVLCLIIGVLYSDIYCFSRSLSKGWFIHAEYATITLGDNDRQRNQSCHARVPALQFMNPNSRTPVQLAQIEYSLIGFLLSPLSWLG